jgi:hypothetical protein
MAFNRCLFVAITIALVCLAQTEIIQPDLADIFYRLDEGKLIPLERQTAAFKGGAHGFIVMSMKAAAEFPGAKSPVRFRTGERIEFVVRSILSGSTVDPNILYSLRKLESKRKTRQLVIMSGHATPLGGSATVTPAEGTLQVEFSKHGASSYKMIVKDLPPGEYAVGRLYGPSVFCFGVD